MYSLVNKQLGLSLKGDNYVLSLLLGKENTDKYYNDYQESWCLLPKICLYGIFWVFFYDSARNKCVMKDTVEDTNWAGSLDVCNFLGIY